MMGLHLVHGEHARRRYNVAAALLGTSILAGLPAQAQAQELPAPAFGGAPVAATAAPTTPAAGPAADAAVASARIQTITVVGMQRLEPDTIRSYVKLRYGQVYSQVIADQALKDLYATELFSEVQVRHDAGHVVIEVKENPVINRIVLEGNKRIKEEKILPDVSRIIELYKRQGRFAATVEPKMVMLEQNRVDIVYEISEGPKSKVRQINILGNQEYSSKQLRGQMVTKQASFTRLFSSGTSYDPDRMAFDQQKLRQFYLTEGYADFRVVSAVAELTPDKKDFILTYVVEEGKRYKFGPVTVESQLRDFDGEVMAKQLPMKQGNWYDAKLVEDTIERLNTTAGTFGYAFADVRPDYNRNKDDLTMGVNFVIAEAPRVYVERIDVNGNTLTQDKVIRREFRIAEGDAFNSLQVKRSTNRIKSLGYFQEKFEVEQKPGSAPDRIILEANVEEKPTGQLQLSAGFSSIENFIFQASVQQRNFRGRGQTVGLSGSYSRYSKSVEASFTEPYLFDRNISAGIDIYRRDYNSFNFGDNDRNNTYSQATTGLQARLGIPLTEYLTAVASYTLNYDNISLGQEYFSERLAPPGQTACEPLIAGRYLCEALGKRTSSILGVSLIHDTLDNRARPTRGSMISVGGDFAGLGGSVKYGRLRINAARYFPVGGGFIFSLSGEGGLIKSFDNSGSVAEGIDDVRLTDRFYLGEPQMRGFDIRGIGPRVLRKQLQADAAGNALRDAQGNLVLVSEDRDQWTDDAIGGKYYYMARAELEIPLGSGAKELGIRPSIFVDAGAVWGVRTPQTPGNLTTITLPIKDSSGRLQYVQVDGVDANGNNVTSLVTNPLAPDGTTANTLFGNPIGPFSEEFLGNTWKPRLAVGVGFNWNSPFGPFRIDFAKVLLKRPGDDTKSFTFNVGTQFQ
jgi:outer membrane protein insertion porin family